MSANRSLVPVTPGALAPADLTRILEEHARDARGAFAHNTERARRADIVVFSRWCADARREPLPATPETVVAFVDAMADAKSTATVRRYVSSIGYAHRAADLPNPTAAEKVRLALKRLHRAKGRAQAQAAPLDRKRVERMLARAETRGGLLGLRDAALLAVAYDTLARRSELVAMLREDVEFGPDGDGTVAIRRSKTDQEGAGAVCYLAPDTLQALRAWLDAAGIADGPLFRAVGRYGRARGALGTQEVARVFKRLARAAGVPEADAARVSGHSTRIGAAQDMVRHGVELPAVMQAGRWRTPEMVARYTARLDARRGGAAKLAERQGRA